MASRKSVSKSAANRSNNLLKMSAQIRSSNVRLHCSARTSSNQDYERSRVYDSVQPDEAANAASLSALQSGAETGSISILLTCSEHYE